MSETTQQQDARTKLAQPATDQLGRTLHDLRISLIDRCNLRCTYCMPKEVFGPGHEFLHKDDWLRLRELDRLVDAFTELGVRKIRLTGGEPLLRPGLIKFIHGLQRFDKVEDIALTTNALLLERYATRLAEAGLSRVTVSLDALDPELLGKINGMGIGPERILEGIKAAQDAELKVKINVVVERGMNESEILPLVDHFRGTGVVLRFIEFMDVGNCNGWRQETVVPSAEILERISERYTMEPLEPAAVGEVARRYRFVDGAGEIGLISSVTAPFCGACNRARISAEGRLFTCLFATEGTDLKPMLRHVESSREDLIASLRSVWQVRADRYSEMRSQMHHDGEDPPKVEMSYIGG